MKKTPLIVNYSKTGKILAIWLGIWLHQVANTRIAGQIIHSAFPVMSEMCGSCKEGE